MTQKFLLFTGCAIGTIAVAAAAVADHYDIVVYGGTSGGVTAAVQAIRDGRSVILISPTSHLGGLTTSGLGWTDLGNTSILGGLNRDFYHRIYLLYELESAWNWQAKSSFNNSAGQGGDAFNHTLQIGSVFEPKVATAIFAQMITEQNVPVVTGRLNLANGVIMTGTRITGLRLEGGREFTGKMFIDATYEGDLLAGAGVSYTVGREANATYHETVSGIQVARANKNQLPNNIDPYVIEGDPSSGLLPGVNADAGGADGSADGRLQAYCYRMVLTDVAENRVTVQQPANYDEADYELLFRAIEAGQSSDFFKLSLMPNRKTDSNNNGGISTDSIGMNYGLDWNWATLGHDQRDALAARHRKWQLGLLWTLQNHPRIPSSVRNNYAKWGLPADEFTDNGHWPHQLYVREARRMVSDFVMTQHHCTGEAVAPDSVGLAAYAMDSHHTQRHVRAGKVKNEGDVQLELPRPYPISYRSIIPKVGECENLFVPWCLSASHMAFGSIRMEPVFMGLAQSAAIAADLALDQEIPVQQVDYAALRPRLLAAGQALGNAVVAPPTSVVDNADAALVSITGAWLSTTSQPGFVGTDYLHDQNTGKGTKSVFFRVPAQISGMQVVSMRWTSNTNRASKVRVEIHHQEGMSLRSLNQRENGAIWNTTGTFRFSGAATEGVKIFNDDSDGFVIADAVGYTAAGPAPGGDTDGDGMSDAREIILGLDPYTSDSAFMTAVKDNPRFFDLYSPQEIHHLGLSAPALRLEAGSPQTLEFSLDERTVDNRWQVSEEFSLPIGNGPLTRRFFKVSVR